MADNQFSILVCSKWERKPTLHLNYIANHLPAEWQSAAVGGFHVGPQIIPRLINANFKCFLGSGREVDAILVHVMRKFYGEWLTQKPTAYLPSDKNAHSQTYQDKVNYSLIHYSLGPFVQRKLFILPIRWKHRIMVNKPPIPLFYIIFPRAPSIVEAIVLVFLFPIYQNRHFASELSFTPKCKIVRRHNFQPTERKSKTCFVIFWLRWLEISTSLPWWLYVDKYKSQCSEACNSLPFPS